MMNYLKRRFSQGDLQGEGEDERQQEMTAASSNAAAAGPASKAQLPSQPTTTSRPPPASATNSTAQINMSFQPLSSGSQSTHSSTTNLSSQPTSRPVGISQTPRKPHGPSPSAPSSPTKTLSFSAMMSAARDILSNSSIGQQQQPGSGSRFLPRQMTLVKDRTKVLFVIDDAQVDWSRYFRNRKLFNDYEIRVEQAEFKEINLASYSNNGTIVDLNVERNGARVVRSFRPDYLLIRQPAKEIDNDWRNLIIGFKYGSVSSTNSLDSIYNFRDKPWVYSQLVQIQKTHGNHMFPLINQTYYPNYKEMLASSFLPCVVKIGHAHSGLGKIRVENALDFQDVSSVVAIANTYSTCEPFIESKCDIHIQKIGEIYKAYMRKSITGSWKCTTGSAMLEQIPVTEKYKFWIDQVSTIFGGLDLCSIQAVVDNEGREYIIDVNDSSFTLLGESQEGDRRQIAELIIDKMSALIQNAVSGANDADQTTTTTTKKPSTSIQRQDPSIHSSSAAIHDSTLQVSSSVNSSRINSPFSSTQSIRDASITAAVSSNAVNAPQGLQSSSNASLTAAHGRHLPTTPNKLPSPQKPQQLPLQSVQARPGGESEQPPPGARQANLGQPAPRSSATSPSTQPGGQRPGPSTSRGAEQAAGRPGSRLPPKAGSSTGEDSEDTMKNLRKTFAGIFGDM